MINICSIEGCV